MFRRSTAVALVVAFAAVPAAFAEATEDTASTRPMVFAHYMTCYFNSVEFYKQEIELAQRHGIDGFALNCGRWKVGDNPGNYVRAAERMYEAARQLDSGFQLFMSPDHQFGAVVDMVERFADHPNQFRWNDKVVMSGWGGRPMHYAGSMKTLADKGRDVVLVPSVAAPGWKMAWSDRTVREFFADQPHMDGVFYFAADGVVADMLRTNAIGRRVTQELDKIFMAGLAPAYNSPNLRDFQGVKGYAAMWEGICRDRPEWVEIVTWSDYNEDSNLMPYRWQRGWDRAYFDRDESFLDVTGYYSAKFKTGRAPEITQDKLYFVYRNRSVWQRQAWDPKRGEWVDITSVEHPFDQIHDDALDRVYVTTALTAPAELTVRLGGEETTFSMPAGMAHRHVPLGAGVPQFVLAREGETLLDVHGRKEIIAKETKENSPRGYHLLNRTWASGAAVGPRTIIEAESGELHGEAETVDVAGATCVRNVESDGSGFTVPVKGLETGTYNIRIRYSNATDREARLTMVADGPPRGENEYPYYIPAFLPPTGEGKMHTTTLFWSLYDKTTFLTVEWRKSVRDREGSDDIGAPCIDRIELVRVEPVEVPERRDPTIPEMVFIPGGEFTMGTADGNPDERPPHKVKLSPFAIGRYEVTNEQFELFRPEHRASRDGYSWRDREPVIYVSWLDAVKYCNWLSEQAGLKPAYAEEEVKEGKRTVTRWKLDARADGFRLPSEAQWEYVATGRGEDRKYPWGDEAPTAGVHGNFAGAEALEIDPDIRSSEGFGVMVVGTYPKGASRDGVMDLAGNVGEWCADWFEPYTKDAKTDPVGDEPGNYRSIRGGSWGYYGLSQRSRDREFNNPKYPGYIYLGFRVALPEAGWKKLMKQGRP